MKKYLLAIDPKIYSQFRAAAKNDGRTMKYLLEHFMVDYVKRTGLPKRKVYL